MKRITLIILISFVLQTAIHSQWVQISSIGNNELRAVKFFNELTGLAAGQGGIWRSTNAGLNWNQIINGQNINSISFASINIGFAVGDTGRVFKTTDNGQSWQQQTNNAVNHLYSVSFYNSTTGYAVGQNGIIIRTTNSGLSWYQNVNQLSEDLNYVQSAINGNTAFAVGGLNNELFTSTGNGGTNWIYSLMIPNNHLRSLHYFSNINSNVIAVGSNGRIRKSTNNGASWQIISSPTSQRLNQVTFVDSNIGFCVGNSGTVLMSTNRGLNWVSQIISASNLFSCSFLNANTGWIVGSEGKIFRTGIPVGIQTQNNHANTFELFQNYPNPFNPNTEISFSLKHNGFIKITIYDALGRNIYELINRYYLAGTHNVTFSSENIPSGTYFYRINIRSETDENYSDVKKMILIK